MRIIQSLRQGPVALLWCGQSLSALGDQLYTVALTWIAVAVMGAAAGYLTALQAGVALVATLTVGRWSDRWDQLRLMVESDLARAALLAMVVTAWLLSGGPSLWMLIAAVVGLAVGQSMFQPAMQAVLPALVERPQLLPATNALMDTTQRSARLLGPGLVAALAGVLPAVHFLTLNALTFLVSAAALVGIKRLRPDLVTPRQMERETIQANLVRGIRAMRAHPLLWFGLRTTGVVNGAWFGVYYLALPIMITETGAQGPDGSGFAAYGLVLSAYGASNLAATLVLGNLTQSVRPQRRMFGGNVVMGVGTLLLGLASLLPGRWVLPGMMAAAALASVGGPLGDIPVAVLRQTRVLAAQRPAAMRLWMAANNAGMLIGMLVLPSPVAALGAAPVVMVAAGVVLAVGLIGLVAYRAWREADAPS